MRGSYQRMTSESNLTYYFFCLRAEDELSKMLLATVRSVCEQYVQFSSVLCIDGLICIRSDAPVIIEPVHIQVVLKMNAAKIAEWRYLSMIVSSF